MNSAAEDANALGETFTIPSVPSGNVEPRGDTMTLGGFLTEQLVAEEWMQARFALAAEAASWAIGGAG